MTPRVAWTGHRPELFLDPRQAEAAVDQLAQDLQPVQRFLVGGQRGVDTWAAEAAHRLGVPFTLYLPLPPDAFANDWREPDRQRLQQTIRWAAEVHVVGGASPEAAYSARNAVLGTAADLLVAVWTGQLGGGTAQTLDFARAAGVAIREQRLAPAPNADLSGRGR